MGNTFITISGIRRPDKQVKTSNGGDYGTGVQLSPGVYTIQAIYEGDDQNDPTSATKNCNS